MSYDLDYLNRRYEKLGKEIKAYQTEQNDIRQAIKRIGQETTEKHAITQAFLEKHPNVVYKDDHGPRFTIDCDETIRLSSTCFSDDDTATLKKLLNDFEQYMELLPYVRKNPNLEGNIAARLYNKTTGTDQYIAFGSITPLSSPRDAPTAYLTTQKSRTVLLSHVMTAYRVLRTALMTGWGLANHAICYVLTLNSKSLTTCQLTLKNSHKSLITLQSV